ncbi:hypothetical protein [Modestobacter sp. URMC 112]
MRIRRPVVALFTALALFGGPATLTACGSPSGLDRNDGDSSDDAQNTSGAVDTDPSQGNLPDNSDNAPDDNSNSERDEGESDGGNR